MTSSLIAVDIGPGPFTGLRAGIATAQAIAAAVGVPIVTVGSLTTLALRASTGRRRIWPIVDVRRGQIATAPYRPVPGGVVADGAPEVVTSDEFAAMLAAEREDTLLVGEWQVLPDTVLRGLHRVKTGRPRFPSADVMLEIAALRAANDDFAGAEDITPALPARAGHRHQLDGLSRGGCMAGGSLLMAISARSRAPGRPDSRNASR